MVVLPKREKVGVSFGLAPRELKAVAVVVYAERRGLVSLAAKRLLNNPEEESGRKRSGLLGRLNAGKDTAAGREGLPLGPGGGIPVWFRLQAGSDPPCEQA